MMNKKKEQISDQNTYEQTKLQDGVDARLPADSMARAAQGCAVDGARLHGSGS
jgi:hypothetical protein